MVVVFLTNSINTPVWEPSCLENANQFSGKSYTTASLGFVPQLLYMGIGNTQDPEDALQSLIRDMACGKQKLVDQAEAEAGGPLSEDHPLKRGLKAIQQAAE